MSDKNESFADVVAEMQTVTCDKCDFTVCPAITSRIDRLVAAHEREVNERAIIAGASFADGETAKLKAQIAELKEAFAKSLERIDDQVRWTIAHIKCNELDDYTGALYTASHALEHISRARAALDKTEGGKNG